MKKKNNDLQKKEISKRLKQSLDMAHMKPTDLANATGIGKSDISNYLNAKYMPKQDRVFLMATALSVDPAWLYALDVLIMKPEKSKSVPALPTTTIKIDPPMDSKDTSDPTDGHTENEPMLFIAQEQNHLSDLDREILSLLRQYNDEEKKNFVRFLESILKRGEEK